MGRVCTGRVGYGPSLSWAEFVMGRDVQLPFLVARSPTKKINKINVLPFETRSQIKDENAIKMVTRGPIVL